MPEGRARVLQLVSRDEPGGVQVLTDLVGSALRARGYEVTTLSLTTPGPLTVKFRHLVATLWEVAKGSDAILAYQAAASIAMGLLGAPRTARRLSHLTAMPVGIRKHWRALDAVAGAIGLYSHIVANSAATASSFDHYPGTYRRRIVLIPHGVTPLPKALTGTDWRARLSIAPSAPLLVAAGRLTSQKNYALAIKALAVLPEVHLAIAGDGPERDDLLGLAQDLAVEQRLHLVGGLPRGELADFVAAGDVYLSPSTWETFGLAAVEAQMAGIPVIASDLPVLREVLGGAGQARTLSFHDCKSPQDLALQIAARLEQYPSGKELNEVAQHAASLYSIESMVRRYLEIIEQP